jgi:hypothetical protein
VTGLHQRKVLHPEIAALGGWVSVGMCDPISTQVQLAAAVFESCPTERLYFQAEIAYRL